MTGNCVVNSSRSPESFAAANYGFREEETAVQLPRDVTEDLPRDFSRLPAFGLVRQGEQQS